MAFNTSSQITNLTWEEPYSNNAPILNYLVTYRQPTFVEGERNRMVNTTKEIVAITALFPGVNYSFTVTAYNEIGPSAPSLPLAVRTLDERKLN